MAKDFQKNVLDLKCNTFFVNSWPPNQDRWKLSAAFVVVLCCAKRTKRRKKLQFFFAKEYKWKKFEGDYTWIVWQYFRATFPTMTILFHFPLSCVYSLLRLITNINFRRFYRQNVVGSKIWMITTIFLLPSLLQFRSFV